MRMFVVTDSRGTSLAKFLILFYNTRKYGLSYLKLMVIIKFF